MIYITTQIQKELSTLLQKALDDGQIQFKTKDGQVFVIRPVPAPKTVNTSPFDVRSIKLPITTADILESIRESRQRYS